jgi:polyvinyl alcohol dehydrogenase (cytochrome)
VLVGAVIPLIATSGSPAVAHRSADWPTWQGTIDGTRHNAAEKSITPRTAGKLTLKWAYAYPKTASPVKSQPAVVGGVIYFGGPEGEFHALDAKTGATKWTFHLNSVSPGEEGPVVLDGPAVARGKVYFGDSRGFVYALDARTGAVKWARDTESHPAGWHTSSPLYHDG